MQSTQLEKMLAHHLGHNLPNHAVKDIYLYACLPAGKLFRPHLVWSILKDLNPKGYSLDIENINCNHSLFGSSVELHHTYTLLHDDLPCMDNDLTRRGRACTHIVYGEWQALLAGDGLLNISYQLLSKIRHHRSQELIRLFSWALGPKGLIHGQVMDLSHEMRESFQNTLRTHELKTARLIQVAILGSAILSDSALTRKKEKKLWKYSRLLGVNFQLIDDLSELEEENLSQHERDVNPWIHFPQESYDELLCGLIHFTDLSKELGLKETNKIVSDYYSKMLSIINGNKNNIENHLAGKKIELSPIILLMQTFCDV